MQTIGLNQWGAAVGMRRKAGTDKNYCAEMEFMVHYQLRGRNESGMTGNCSNEISPVATGHRALGSAGASHEGSGFRCGCGFMMMAHHVAMVRCLIFFVTHGLFAHRFTGRSEGRREHCANQSHNDRDGKCPAHFDERGTIPPNALGNQPGIVQIQHGWLIAFIRNSFHIEPLA